MQYSIILSDATIPSSEETGCNNVSEIYATAGYEFCNLITKWMYLSKSMSLYIHVGCALDSVYML